MKKKYFLQKLIIVLLVCSALIFAALHIDFVDVNDDGKVLLGDSDIKIDENYEGADINLADFLYKDIYINGQHFNNWNMTYPVTVIEGKYYLPMTEKMEKVLGIKAYLEDEKHHFHFEESEEKETGAYDLYDDAVACNLLYLEVFWNHQYYFNYEEVPLGSAATAKLAGEDGKRVLYISLDALRDYVVEGLSYYYDDISGLYISTNENVSAESLLNLNNQKYIEGRARFMMDNSAKVDLDMETALFYEYLFRHEASIQEYVTEDMLMAVCYGESRFNAEAESYMNAIGLMQILYKYAEKSDYSEEMLKDPHYNVEYGAATLNGSLERFDGDRTLGFTAYNRGYYSLKSLIDAGKSYDTNYAQLVDKRENMIKSYLLDNGYAVDFDYCEEE